MAALPVDTPAPRCPHRSAANAPRRIRISQPGARRSTAGATPPKRTVGDTVAVSADIFRDGHEKLRAVVALQGAGRPPLARGADARRSTRTSTACAGRASSRSRRPARWQCDDRGLDRPLRDLARRAAAQGRRRPGGPRGRALRGRRAARDARSRAPRATRQAARSSTRSRVLATPTRSMQQQVRRRARPGALRRDGAQAQERHGATTLEQAARRSRSTACTARFGAWYELFPRSWGGLKAVEEQRPGDRRARLRRPLPAADPPDRRQEPQGPQQHARRRPGRPRLAVRDRRRRGRPRRRPPRARHRCEDVRALCATAHEHGMDVALDIALNASADHPWLTEHPEWFQQRPDGTLKYAENPPKRTRTSTTSTGTRRTGRSCGRSGADVVLHWVDAGVKVFRVDNPHTKPFPFWEWLIKEVHKVDRDVVFLAEAFTRRAVMRELAKLGFTQSYTYFTWKNSRHELIEYVNELAWSAGDASTSGPTSSRSRRTSCTPTSQHGGPPAFVTRLVLAGDAEPELRHLLGLRALRERAGARGLRGVPELREVRDPRARARRPAAADDPPHQRDPAREPGAPAPLQRRSGSRPTTTR